MIAGASPRSQLERFQFRVQSRQRLFERVERIRGWRHLAGMTYLFQTGGGFHRRARPEVRH